MQGLSGGPVTSIMLTGTSVSESQKALDLMFALCLIHFISTAGVHLITPQDVVSADFIEQTSRCYCKTHRSG